MCDEKKYLFGPVPSRRLGLSLGVDLVPFKYCPLDCIYCQLGRTTTKTLERSEFVPIEEVLSELSDKTRKGLRADYITLSGSGEPTLYSRLGELIDGIKKITPIPVALITNGILLSDQSVRKDSCKADLILPSLDAASNKAFKEINRPVEEFDIQTYIDGLVKLRPEYSGPIWLEVFLVDGINTSPEELSKIKNAIDQIHPDRIQLNTSVRPTAFSGVKRMDAKQMERICEEFGENCEVIAEFSSSNTDESIEITSKDVLSMLKRRPCTLEDVCEGLGIHKNEALKYISHFQKHGAVVSEQVGDMFYFKAI